MPERRKVEIQHDRLLGPLADFNAGVAKLADAGAMRQFAGFARATGLRLESILDNDLRRIVAAAATSDKIPAQAMVDVLQVCATISGRQNLGMSFAAWGNLRGYGPLSLLWDHCPSLSEAFRVNQQYLHLETTALTVSYEKDGNEVAIENALIMPSRYGGSQFIEATLTLGMLVGRLVLGPTWSAKRLELSHSPPADPRYHRALFRCPIQFNADRCALVVDQSDMHQPGKSGNAHMFAYLERHLAATNRTWPIGLVQQVEQVIATSLKSGGATLRHVAGVLAMSERTLHRRLKEVGVSFSDLLSKTRHMVAEEYLRSVSRPNLIQLAHLIGYADATGASRYLKHEFGRGLREICPNGLDSK